MGVSVISSYSNQFKNAAKMLTKAETHELLKKRQFENAHNETVNRQNTYFATGLLYYNHDRRLSLLDRAEKLCYSKAALERLKTFNCDNWNSDNVTITDIKELASIEQFVREHTPSWEKSVFSQIGKFVNEAE